MPDQERDVFGSLAERREAHGDNVEAIVEVRAEFLLPDHCLQVPVRGGDESRVRAERSGASQSLKLALLQYPQKLRLQFEGDLADLVKKRSPPVRQLEPADALRDCPGERSSLMAE